MHAMKHCTGKIQRTMRWQNSFSHVVKDQMQVYIYIVMGHISNPTWKCVKLVGILNADIGVIGWICPTNCICLAITRLFPVMVLKFLSSFG